MTRRERMLFSIVCTFVGVAFFGVGVKKFVVDPLKEKKQQIGVISSRLGEHRRAKKRAANARRRMVNVASRTYAGSLDEAQARCGREISELLRAAGLDESVFTRRPVRPSRVGSEAFETGWTLRGVGPLKSLVDFLYLLDSVPYASKIEKLSLTPSDRVTGSIHFTYLTLALPKKWRDGVPPIDRQPPASALATAERKAYDVITGRNFFAPFAPTPEPPPVPARDPVAEERDRLAAFRVVSLSEWKGTPEVMVLDVEKESTEKYYPGDTLAGGEILTIDYRALPNPAKPGMTSISRVIIGAGAEFWAIENGATLAERRRLKPEDLPSGLQGR